ncbi:MAG TPA: hypothetical protein VGK93_05435 [Candidatus Eisenbacteria bacterium]|jgi:pimeloyl-ACP methyl ester carboxylesterase
MKRAVCLWLLTLALGNPGTARASEPVDRLLIEAATPEALRARLLSHAAAVPDSGRVEKGEAWYYAGLSYDRDGLVDSAIVCYQQAYDQRGETGERDALVDALLLRDGPGDPARALALLRRPAAATELSTSWDPFDFDGRQVWALYLGGQTDSALQLLHTMPASLYDERNPLGREWRYRAGLMELEHGDPTVAYVHLTPLALASRLKDADVMQMMREIGDKTGAWSHLQTAMNRELAVRDRDELLMLNGLKARRVRFQAEDGFPLGGIVFAPSGSRRARAAVILLPHDIGFGTYDSLCTGLRRAGYASVLLELRGAGGSVDRSCPLPGTWRGRETRMQSQVARDVVFALRALAMATPVDTTAYLVVGDGPTASIAIEAAELDPRVRLLVLLSPAPCPVDLGPSRARLEATRLPTFFEVPAEDMQSLPVADAWNRAADPRASRVVESERVGHAAQVFRYDREALLRLRRWLDETWLAGRGRAPRRSR